MSEEKHSPCRICDATRVLIDGIFCNSCYELIEHISNYYGEINHRFNQTTKGK